MLTKGDKIEILKTTTTANNTTPAWFPATVIDPPSPSTVHVKYTTLFTETNNNGGRKRKRIREYVNVNDVVMRRVPELQRGVVVVVVREEVEVFDGCGWRRAVVKEVLEGGCKYKVVGGVDKVVEKVNVRVLSTAGMLKVVINTDCDP